MRVAGVLLAAGAGSRMGHAKALMCDPEGTAWVVRQSRVLREGGCDPVLVVLGAEFERSAALLEDEPVTIVRNPGWVQGMGSSVQLGLAASPSAAGAVTIAVVDTPGLTPEVVRRINGQASTRALVRATYHGVPGHPVLIGREHWAGVASSADGDHGARVYLADHPPVEVECADIGTGGDIDVPGDLPPGHRGPGWAGPPDGGS